MARGAQVGGPACQVTTIAVESYVPNGRPSVANACSKLVLHQLRTYRMSLKHGTLSTRDMCVFLMMSVPLRFHTLSFQRDNRVT